MSKQQQTLKKMAEAAYIVAKVIRIIIYVATGIIFSTLVFVMVSDVGQSMGLRDVYSENTGAVTIHPGIIADIGMGGEEMVCTLSNALAYAVITAVILHYLGAIFKSIRNEGSPFDIDNVKSLKKVAISIALLSVIPAIVEVAVTAVLGMMGSLKLHVEVTFIALAFFFLCLAYIFEYGAELQRQSDETL